MPIDPLKYNSDLVEPFAQVTVVDAAHGDANLIDLCEYSAAGNARWRRILIDTGPPSEQKQIMESCLDVLRRAPRPQATSDTVNVPIPPLNEFQITHKDADHIGNAPELLVQQQLIDLFRKWKSQDLAYRCWFIFPHVPPAVPAWGLQQDWRTPVYVKVDGVDCNATVIRLSDNVLDWARDMHMFGFHVELKVSLQPAQNFDWNEGDMLLDPYGADTNAPRCLWNQTYRNNTNFHTVHIDVAIYDHGGSHGPVLAVEDGGNIEVRFSALDWVAAPANDFTGAILPRVVEGLPPLLSEPTFDLRTPRFRQVPIPAARPKYLAKLGTAVQALCDEDLASTENALIARKQSFVMHNTEFAVEYYVNPSLEVYRNFGRFELINDYLKFRKGSNAPDGAEETDEYDPDSDSIATNRSSTVTLFSRSDTGLKMLFTADAYDRNCDIRRTILSFDNDANRNVKLHVLKLPHHGSEVTVDSSFYDVVHAEVYLVCGDHHNISQNPRLSTLVAIVRSFEGRTRPSGFPFRLFFSSEDILTNYGVNRSAVAALITSRWGPKKVDGKWTYEIYRIVDSWGRIVFGAQQPYDPANPILVEAWNEHEFKICHDWDGTKAVVINIVNCAR